MGKVLVILAITGAVFAAVGYKAITGILADGEFDASSLPDFYWGPTNLQNKPEDTKIHPFSIKVEDKVLESLKAKLKEEINSGREVAPLEGIEFQYGFNSNYLKTVTQYWLNKYDWRAREKLLNQYPQFKTKIAGIDIHFQHVKSGSKGKYKVTRPLLLLHGWPGSFVEFQKIIPMLTDPQNSEINFELIIPSLPGYGFSEAAARPGLGPLEVGQVFTKLMKRLGHNKFYVQGGDFGSLIATNMATLYPENVVAMHSNMCSSMHPRSNLRALLAALVPSTVSAEDAPKVFPLSSYYSFIVEETGYLHIQATKPDTVGVGLTHSPSGLAAYLIEKFSTWTNIANRDKPDGGLTSKFTLDELLDNVMVYWVSNSITTSMRIYAEALSSRQRSYKLDNVPVKVPTGCIVPRNEPYIGQSKEMVQDKYTNLVRYNVAADGGHFFGMELPEVLAKDVLEFVKKLESDGTIKAQFQ